MKKRSLLITFTFIAGFTIGNSVLSDTDVAKASTSGQKVCVNKTTGVIRLASIKKCIGNERSLTLGAEGPMGPQGPQGSQGPTGAPGPIGPQGAAGSSASNESIKTKTVTLTYMSTDGIFSPCGSGTSSIFKSGYIYDGLFFDADRLTSSFNWDAVYNCSITLKVLDQ